MAIQFAYTDPVTGAVSPKAHMILDDPILRGEVQHVVVRGRVYATKADYDAGMAPIGGYEHEYGEPEYLELRGATIPLCEAWVLREHFPPAEAPHPDQTLPVLLSGMVLVDD